MNKPFRQTIMVYDNHIGSLAMYDMTANLKGVQMFIEDNGFQDNDRFLVVTIPGHHEDEVAVALFKQAVIAMGGDVSKMNFSHKNPWVSNHEKRFTNPN
jgi:hypothetical protein